jgi:hypothetical protein
MEEKITIPKVTGSISISFHLYCPHCSSLLDDYSDREWWNKTMGSSFPSDGVDGTHEAVCPKCDKEFDIEGFIH